MPKKALTIWITPHFWHLSKVIVCDTIKINNDKKMDKLEIVSVADVFGESMKRIVEGTSLSSLFKGF